MFYHIRKSVLWLILSAILPLVYAGTPENWMNSFGAGTLVQTGKTYYASPDGRDSNDGLTRQTAFRNLNHAVSKLAPGDTLLLAGGEYPGDVRINISNTPQANYSKTSGKANAPIRIMGIPGEEAVISGSQLLTGGSKLPGSNVYYYNTQRKPTSNMLIDRATHTVLQEVFAEELVREYPGTYMRKSDGGLLVHYASKQPDGVLYPRNFFGFVIAGSFIHVENITFKYCIDGVNLRVNAPYNKNQAAHNTVKNCRFFYNTRMGLYVDGASDSLISGNIFLRNGKRGSLLTTASPRKSRDCLIAGNYFGETPRSERNVPENFLNFALGNYAQAPERIHFVGNYVKSSMAFRLKPASPGGRVEDNFFDGYCSVEGDPVKAFFRRNYFKDGLTWLKIGRRLQDKDFKPYPMVFENNVVNASDFAPQYKGALQAEKLAMTLPEGSFPDIEFKDLSVRYINRNSAVIVWQTPECDGTGYVEYAPVGSKNLQKSMPSQQGVKHFAGMTGLLPDTLYRCRVVFESRRKQRKVSDFLTFRTPVKDRPAMTLEVGQGKLSLSEASAMTIAGDTIKLLPGEHVGVFAPVNSGLPGKPITLSGHNAVINGRKFHAPLINLNNVSHIVIDGVTLADPESQSSYSAIKIRKSNNVTIKNCRSKLCNYMAGPFVFVLKSQNVTIYNNISWGFSYPLQLAESEQIKVVNNTIVDAAMFSVFAENTQDMTFENNIFYRPCVANKTNPAYIFQGVDLNRVKSDGNVFYSPYKQHGTGGIVRAKNSRVLFASRTLKEWQQRSKLDKNSMVCDPLFEDYKNGNFALKVNSPVKGRGALQK